MENKLHTETNEQIDGQQIYTKTAVDGRAVTRYQQYRSWESGVAVQVVVDCRGKSYVVVRSKNDGAGWFRNVKSIRFKSESEAVACAQRWMSEVLLPWASKVEPKAGATAAQIWSRSLQF